MVQRGFTLVEIIISLALLMSIMVFFSPMMNLTFRAFGTAEVQSALKDANQDAINKIGYRLIECKKLFENNGNDVTFFSRAQLTTSSSPLTGSVMPKIEEDGHISPSSSSFVAGSVGNMLFFASLEQPEDMVVTQTDGSTASVRIDAYRFNAYYLVGESGKPLGGKVRRSLWEWHSVKFADYGQLSSIADVARSTNSVGTLASRGYAAAWDASTNVVTGAFYLMGSTGSLTRSTTYQIIQDSCKRMVQITPGALGSSYLYGVSPNSDADFSLRGLTVPGFGVASTTTTFPSGFEVVAVGPSSSRQVLIRIILVAQGAFFKEYPYNQQLAVFSVRDIW